MLQLKKKYGTLHSFFLHKHVFPVNFPYRVYPKVLYMCVCVYVYLYMCITVCISQVFKYICGMC